MQENNQIEEIMMTLEEDLQKSVDFLKGEYGVIRAGRANPHILDRVMVDYYGSPTPLNQLANMNVQEARLLVVSLFDISQIKAVSKAIAEADLGVNISDDGRVIRLAFPALTEERRKDIVKQEFDYASSNVELGKFVIEELESATFDEKDFEVENQSYDEDDEEDVYDEIKQKCARGNELADSEKYQEALTEFSKALELLPKPDYMWEAATWLYGAIGDMYFQLNDYSASLDCFMKAQKCPDGMGNPFICVRIGECFFELGNIEKAKQYLMQAYMLEGEEIFLDAAPKYLALILPLI